jgi:hypothetical protein
MVGLASHVAFADDTIPTVNLGDAGPDRSIPVGKSFYLVSKAPETVSFVRPVIVRTRYAGLISVRSDSCTATIAALGLPDKAKLQSVGTGVLGDDALWPGAITAFAGPEWKRGDLKDKQDVKVLIENDSKFFETGARYCLVQYQITQKIDVDHTRSSGARESASTSRTSPMSPRASSGWSRTRRRTPRTRSSRRWMRRASRWRFARRAARRSTTSSTR